VDYVGQQEMLGKPEEVIGDMNCPLTKHVTDAIVGVLRHLCPIGRVGSIRPQFNLEPGASVVPAMRETGSAVDGVPEDGREHSEDHFRQRR